MPLIKGRKKPAKMDMDDESKPNELAIAYSVKRKPKKMADGGMASSMDDVEKEISDATDARQQANDAMDQDSDPIEVASKHRYARGGSVAERIMGKRMADGGKVDSQENADEQPEMYDDLNEEAVKKEYYDLSQLDEQPLSSVGHDQEDKHDMDLIDRIRARMRNRRGV